MDGWMDVTYACVYAFSCICVLYTYVLLTVHIHICRHIGMYAHTLKGHLSMLSLISFPSLEAVRTFLGR